MALLDHFGGLSAGDDYSSLNVIGATGAAYADDHHNVQLLYQGGHARAVRTGEGILATVAMLQQFVDRMRSDWSTETDLPGWRNVSAVAEAVHRSLESQRAIKPEVV
jgi:hypothetical protein